MPVRGVAAGKTVRSARPADAAGAKTAPAKKKAAESSFKAGATLNRAQNPLRPDAKARIRDITFANPTASNAELAKLFAADATLKGLRGWSEDEVRHLRDESHVVPSARAAGVALGGHLTKAAKDVGPKTDLGGFIAQMAKRYPGVTREQVLKLTRTDRALAKAMQPLWVRERTAELPKVAWRLDQSKVRELGLGR
ncbi:MAG: hypothetical protein JNK82_40475, partial [Myxococcaceae bacterium]|nr:hypothetical protein [Myxococcaceae bacterium]